MMQESEGQIRNVIRPTSTSECKDYRDIIAALGKVGSNPSDVFRLFGLRGFEAWQLVKEKRIKKYVFKPSGRVQWVVVGENAEYIIYEKAGYCHCDDFYYSVMNGKAECCKHLIAQRLAENMGIYDVVEEPDENFMKRMDGWRKIP